MLEEHYNILPVAFARIEEAHVSISQLILLL